MSRSTPLPAAASADEIPGEVRAFAATVGRPGTTGLGESLPVDLPPEPMGEAGWRGLVGHYFRNVLLAHEGPLIIQAHGFASLGQARELVALDQEWGRIRATLPPPLQFLGDASFRVGQRQLNRLRPLRDQRLVQRYLAAIEAGDARGWHPLVYGVVLSVFALPLRQGLALYSRQAAAGFLVGSSLAADLAETRKVELLDEVMLSVQPALQQLLPAARMATI